VTAGENSRHDSGTAGFNRANRVRVPDDRTACPRQEDERDHEQYDHKGRDIRASVLDLPIGVFPHPVSTSFSRIRIVTKNTASIVPAGVACPDRSLAG
jgi:hypothetical protein